jgi:two-component system, NarL family, sensor histidine kinase UhpB
MSHRSAAQRPILWRVFTVNAVVFGAAVLTLALSPATVHSPIRIDELVVLLGGLLLTLLVDLALLALVLSPVRRLAGLMGDIDPMRPGQRAVVGESRWGGTEVSVLARAFNAMLDRIETERRESARRAIAAQEAERMRIARELHDEVGQTLTAVALRVERAAAEGAAQPQTLGEIATVIHRSLDDVRRIARELRPEALDDLGLGGALNALGLRVERHGSVRVRRELDGSLPQLGSEVELVIYRVAQEALTNALRHAGAGHVSLALRSEEGGVRLIVEDDGSGLPEDRGGRSAEDRGSGLPEDRGPGEGLTGMRERAMLIGGDLSVGRSSMGGVKIDLSIPPRARR